MSSTFRIKINDNFEDFFEDNLDDLAVAGENLTAGDVCYLNTDGKYWRANANSLATSSTEMRIAKEDVVADTQTTFLAQGYIASSGLTVGVRYFLSTLTGQITTIEPTGTNISRYVGTAKAEDLFYFNPLDIKQNVDGDKTYIHTQASPASTWTITHNMGKRPSVTVIDSANTQVVADVEYVDDNNLILTFSAAFSGTATLN